MKFEDANKIYKTSQERLIERIAHLRTIKLNEMLNSSIPNWKAKLMQKSSIFGKIFGYKIKIQNLPPLESDVIREELTLMKRKKEVATIEFRASDRRKLDGNRN